MSDYERFLETKSDNFCMSEHHYFAKSLAIEHGFKTFRGDPCVVCGETLRYAQYRSLCVACTRKKGARPKKTNASMADLVKQKPKLGLSNMAWC